MYNICNWLAGFEVKIAINKLPNCVVSSTWYDGACLKETWLLGLSTFIRLHG